LLFIDVPDLEPNISVGEGTRRVAKDAVKTGQRLCIFRLLLIDNAKAEKDFIGLVKVLIMVSKTRRRRRRGKFTFVHAKDRGEGLLGMIERTISVVENSNTIPELRIIL